MTRSEGGDPFAIAARARAAGMTTVFVKSSDGVDDWDQFEPGLVALLHAQGLRVCAWQFVYGNDPEGEARLGAAAAADGADCLVIDAETHYEGKYAQAQRYISRAALDRRGGISRRPDVVPLRRLPRALPVLRVPRARRRAGEPPADLLEGHRRDRRRGERAHARA